MCLFVGPDRSSKPILGIEAADVKRISAVPCKLGVAGSIPRF